MTPELMMTIGCVGSALVAVTAMIANIVVYRKINKALKEAIEALEKEEGK